VVPTLLGRLQSRVVLLVVVGSLVTLLVTPILPGDAPLGDAYLATFRVLFIVLVLGLGWELAYHFLMQFRWEKDWPSLFGLVTMVPEGLLVWILLDAGAVPGFDEAPPAGAFLIHFVLVWLAVWLVANGPLRVPFIRWRFRGGRFV
jgi:hypothetical protein